MRVAILGSKGIPGRHGVEVVVEETATRLAALGHDITIFGYDWYMKGSEEGFGGCALRPVTPVRSKFLEMPSVMIKSVRAVLRDSSEFDLVHIHSADPCYFAAPLVGRLPLAATSHGRGYRRTSVGAVRSHFSRLAEKRFIDLSDAASCVSPADTDHYNSSYPGAEVTYIPNGMPQLGKGSESDLSQWGLKRGEYVLFSAGRILPSKGLHTLLDAWDMLDMNIPLVIVGGPSAGGERYYREQVGRAPETVLFTGFVSDARLWSLYRYPGLAVFPSEAEAQSMTLLEFLAMGLDVVYSDIPENSLVAGDIGRAFKCGSASSLATVMRGALEGTLPCQPDQTGLGELVKRHDWDSIAQDYIELYKRAVFEFGRGRLKR